MNCVLPAPCPREGWGWKNLKRLDSRLRGNDVKGNLFRVERLSQQHWGRPCSPWNLFDLRPCLMLIADGEWRGLSDRALHGDKRLFSFSAAKTFPFACIGARSAPKGTRPNGHCAKTAGTWMPLAQLTAFPQFFVMGDLFNVRTRSPHV